MKIGDEITTTGVKVAVKAAAGLKNLRMLYAALATVLLGGGAAVGAAKLVVKSEADRMEEHLKIDHPALERRLDRVENATEDSRYESQCARANSEALLRYWGMPVPKIERRQRAKDVDAGE